MSLSEVEAGDRIIVRTGGMIPLDGKVVAGEAMVNQASITGEPLAVRKTTAAMCTPARWWRKATAPFAWKRRQVPAGMTASFT